MGTWRSAPGISEDGFLEGEAPAASGALGGEARMQPLPVLLALPRPKCGGGQNPDLLKRIEHEEVPIAGDDRHTLAGYGRREHDIIIGVTARRRV